MFKFSAIATIEVKIIDVNDNPPYFPHSFYNATVREDGVIGSNVILVQARDIDSGKYIRLSVVLVEAKGIDRDK